MEKSNLIPKNLSKELNHRDLSKKGGQSKSMKKKISSRLNGYLAKKDLTKEQKQLINLVRSNDFVDVLKVLLSRSILDIENPQRREKLIDQMIKLLPQESINYEISGTTQNSTQLPAGIFVHVHK